jgi:hypothetical protein
MQCFFEQSSNTKKESKAVANKTSEVQYISCEHIYPGQIRYSSLNTADKVAKLKEKKAVFWDAKDNCWQYKYHDGTSVLASQDALPVVKASFGYVLIDGHHDVLSSLAVQAKMIPIKVVDDLHHLSLEEFWNCAEERGYTYLYKANGEQCAAPSSFSDLIDDPNRYFAAITARKYTANEDGYDSRGAEFPLWIKINKGIPFIEFKIANALFAKGFVYDPEQMGNPPKEEAIEQARAILIAAKVPGFGVVPSQTHYQRIIVDFEANTYEVEQELPHP